jgi:hypothetical protein
VVRSLHQPCIVRHSKNWQRMAQMGQFRSSRHPNCAAATTKILASAHDLISGSVIPDCPTA